MKKLLFVTARLPYPPISGQKNVLYNYCRILHEVYDYEITVASFLEQGDVLEPWPEFIKTVIPLPDVSGRQKLVNLVMHVLLWGKYPIQVALYWSPQIKRTIDALIEQLTPSVAIADMVRTTEYLRDFNRYRIANLTDLLSVRYLRQLRIDMSEINPYGAFFYVLPALIQRVAGIKALKKWVLRKEIRQLERYEQEIGRLFERTLFVSQKEVDAFNTLLKEDRATCVPLGVDVESLGEAYRKYSVDVNAIAFLGAMNVAHNEAAVVHFAQDILPEILRREPGAVLRVVGNGVTDRLRALESPHVIFTGRVNDVREHVASCRVFVCPLEFGSGIKTKNLEAMAMGVPVVTTSIGAEGINALNGEDWLVADDDRAFANAVVSLIQDERLYMRLQENGRAFVQEHCSWKEAERRMREALPE